MEHFWDFFILTLCSISLSLIVHGFIINVLPYNKWVMILLLGGNLLGIAVSLNSLFFDE